jgi:carbohydrate diacid regulator
MDKIIPYNINVMNEEGVIIASKDPERIGSFHKGALQVIQDGKTVKIYPEDTVPGAKEGINMPLFFQGKIIGVIGITGHPIHVESYGKIILKMTEMMINEASARHELQVETQAKEWLIHEWLLGQFGDPETLALRGEVLGVDVKHPRSVLFIRLSDENIQPDDVQRQAWIDDAVSTLQNKITMHKQDIIVPWRTNQFLLLASMEKREEASFAEHVFQLLDGHTKDKAYSFYCGTGRTGSSIEKVIDSYNEASHAIEYATASTPLVFYEKLGVESLLIRLSEKEKADFVSRFFPFMYNEEHETLKVTLKLFFQNDQSIEKTSEKLFIHKNTLQYRLKKAEAMTGHDPRSFRGGVLFYLALQMIE